MAKREVMEEEILIDHFDDDVQDVIPFRYSITSYGADYPVDSMVKRLKNDDIFIPLFQRQYIWSAPQASGFVETLLLGLPVPGILHMRNKVKDC